MWASIILSTLLIRCGFLATNYLQHPAKFLPDTQEYMRRVSDGSAPVINDFGYEASNIAYALVCRKQGFSNPFGGDTGPTGWIAPGSVALYAVAFLLFGCFSGGAVFFTYSITMVVSLGMLYTARSLGRHYLGTEAGGLATAALFAFGPESSLYYSQKRLDFNLPAFWMLLVFTLLVRLNRMKTLRAAGLLSLASAVATLFQPHVIMGSVVGVLFVCLGTRQAFVWKALGIFALVHLSVVGPYLCYQRTKCGEWIFVKSNAPFELYLGNTEASQGALTSDVFRASHPSQNKTEYIQYKSLGESAYIRSKYREFTNTFELGGFIKTCIKRVGYFFFIYKKEFDEQEGILLWGKRFLAALPGAVFLAYLVYRWKRFRKQDVLLYLFILCYSVPFFVAAAMPRYVLPLLAITCLPLAGLTLAMIKSLRQPINARVSGIHAD